MATTNKSTSTSKGAKDNLADLFKNFGSAIGEIFDDPKLKKNFKELGNLAGESVKSLGDRFKDQDVKKKFKLAGQAASDLGKNITDLVKKNR